MATYDVYLPVCVTVTDGLVTAAGIEWEGAPWMGLDEPNIWDQDTDEWLASAGEGGPVRAAEDEASAILSRALGNIGPAGV